MNANPALSLKEQFGPKSHAWQEQQSPPIARLWCDNGNCWGIPFFQVSATHYNADQKSLLIECGLGTTVVTGPKAWDFYALRHFPGDFHAVKKVSFPQKKRIRVR
jgi:hypothetical protein